MRGWGPAVPSGAAVTYRVQFSVGPRPTASKRPSRGQGRLPNVTRLLVLAHKIDGMIRAGEIRDWAEAARLAGVTRAWMTQIANLLLLSPDIQEALISSSLVPRELGKLNERQLRLALTSSDWRVQARTLMARRGTTHRHV